MSEIDYHTENMTESGRKQRKFRESAQQTSEQLKSGQPENNRQKSKEDRRKKRRGIGRALFETLRTLVNVAAVAVLIAVLLLPVLRIYGNSMTPSLLEGDLVVSVKGTNFQRGDIIAFYYNNKVLVKRVIALDGEWVDISDSGQVSINGEALDEPYAQNLSLGTCDIELPYQVPEDRIFVMGDKRAVSIDSRSSAIGCVAKEQIVGKIVFRIWPLSEFGPVK